MSQVDPREETAAALAALQIAGHALGVACDKLNALLSCRPEHEKIDELTNRASNALGEVNDLAHKVRYAQKGIREWEGES